MTEIPCEFFRDSAPELAFGTLESHWAADLFEHAAGCVGCQRHLDDLVLIGDRLLLAAPQMAPPPGFEERVVARMRPPAPVPIASGERNARRIGLLVAAAIALVGLSIGGGYAVGDHGSGRPVIGLAVSRAGTILRGDGTTAGTITLTDQPRALALITIDHPRAGAGVVTCELLTANGQATTIGSWSSDQIARGAWAVGIDPELLTAQRMNLRNVAGAVVASAVLR